MKIIKVALLSLFIACGLINAVEPIQAQPMPIINKNIVVAIPLMMAARWLATFFHELGHASATYAFTGIFPRMIIGDRTRTVSPYINTTSLAITSLSQWPPSGTTLASSLRSLMSPLQKAVVALNGPLFGTVSLVALNKIIHTVLKPTCVDQLMFAYGIIDQIRNLVPFKVCYFETDGYQFLKDLGFKTDLWDWLSKFFFYFKEGFHVVASIAIIRHNLNLELVLGAFLYHFYCIAKCIFEDSFVIEDNVINEKSNLPTIEKIDRKYLKQEIGDAQN